MCRALKASMDPSLRVTRSRPKSHRIAAVAAFGLAALLGACVAVPIDARTGAPLAWPPVTGNPTAPAGVPVPMPVAPAAPVSYTARLYPINDIANRAGMLTAIVTDGHGGRGSFSLSYLGDAMQGEATRVEGQQAVLDASTARCWGCRPSRCKAVAASPMPTARAASTRNASTC